MRAQVGKYHFGRHRSNWGIWQYECVSESGCTMSRFVKDVYTYDDAVREVYALNGWGQPKQIRKSY